MLGLILLTIAIALWLYLFYLMADKVTKEEMRKIKDWF
jgi:hypothetical protein